MASSMTNLTQNQRIVNRIIVDKMDLTRFSLTVYFVSIFCIFFLSFAEVNADENNTKPIWITSNCYQFKFSVGDKLDSKPLFKAKYLVREINGSSYVAERDVSAHQSNTSAVTFPDDFYYEKIANLKADIQPCYPGKFIFEIYADDELVDSGRFEFSNNSKLKNKKK